MNANIYPQNSLLETLKPWQLLCRTEVIETLKLSAPLWLAPYQLITDFVDTERKTSPKPYPGRIFSCAVAVAVKTTSPGIPGLRQRWFSEEFIPNASAIEKSASPSRITSFTSTKCSTIFRKAHGATAVVRKEGHWQTT